MNDSGRPVRSGRCIAPGGAYKARLAVLLRLIVGLAAALLLGTAVALFLLGVAVVACLVALLGLCGLLVLLVHLLGPWVICGAEKPCCTGTSVSVRSGFRACDNRGPDCAKWRFRRGNTRKYP
mgnify:CR=1 FL=1